MSITDPGCCRVEGKQLAVTKEDKIRKLEEAIQESKARFMTTSNQCYGRETKAVSLELFDCSTNNIVKSEDLMPCPRRPKK